MYAKIEQNCQLQKFTIILDYELFLSVLQYITAVSVLEVRTVSSAYSTEYKLLTEYTLWRQR